MIIKFGGTSKGSALHWYCNACNNSATQAFLLIKSLQEKQTAFEAKFDTMATELDDIRSELALHNNTQAGSLPAQDIADVKNEIAAIKASYANIVSNKTGTATSTVSSAADVVSKEVRLELSEAIEREKRRKNLIVRGIAEDLDEAEVKEKITLAIKSCNKISSHHIQFLGRVGIARQSNKERPYRICIEDNEARHKTFKGATSLKQTEEFKNVYIMPDLTRKQQEADKKIRDKLKELRSQGEQNVKIHKGDIVKMAPGGKLDIIVKSDN